MSGLIRNIKTILIVDDEEDIRAIVCDMVRIIGHLTIEASNGNEAIQKASIVKPDLLIMDVNIPGIDGWSAIDAIRRYTGVKDLPAIVMSGEFTNRTPVCDDRRSNCVMFAKPFAFSDIELHINRLLKGEACPSCGKASDQYFSAVIQ